MRDHYNGSIQNVALHRLEVMEPYLAPGEAMLCLPDAIGSSKILPKSVKAKTIETLAVREHPGVGFAGGAEFTRCHSGIHVVEDRWLEDLDACKHQFANRPGRLHRRSCVKESTDPALLVDVH